MHIPFISSGIRRLYAVFGVSDRQHRALKNLQNANKTFAITVIANPVMQIDAPETDEWSSTSSEGQRAFSWKHTWSTRKDFRQTQQFRSLKIKGKMYALPCRPHTT